MPANSPVALILGAGSNIGQHVARAFASQGYKHALAARSLKEEDSTAEEMKICSDFSDPESVVKAFAKVEAQMGIPSVVVYNAAAGGGNPAGDPLNVPLEDFERDLKINVTSVFIAAQQAVLAFGKLDGSASKTFIYTGNALNDNTITIERILNCGIGKSATAHLIHTAANSYKDRGFKFYYADERKADGAPVYGAIDGAAHGKHYTELAAGASQGPWQQTFVKGTGYKSFPVR